MVVEVEGHAASDARGRRRSRSCRATTRICWPAGPGLPPADVSEVGWITAEGVHRVSAGTDGAKAEVWCGFLGTAKTSAHPLLDALPPLLTLDVAGGEAQWLDSSMRFLAEQQPSPEMVARLAELFLRRRSANMSTGCRRMRAAGCRGWPIRRCRKALSIIHKRYAEDLDVEGLAREAGVSRTVLGERFAELIGEPPMRYCARWRMRIAANMLRDGKQNTANIAYAVGFNSEAAFNRAFKREYGEPPATWRRRIEDEERARAKAHAAPSCRRSRSAIARASDGTRLAFSVDRRRAAAGQDGELAQPYRARLGQPAVAALDRTNSPTATR